MTDALQLKIQAGAYYATSWTKNRVLTTVVGMAATFLKEKVKIIPTIVWETKDGETTQIQRISPFAVLPNNLFPISEQIVKQLTDAQQKDA